MKHNKSWKITAYLLNNPNKDIRVSEVARELGLSKASVSLVAKKLRMDGIMKGMRVDLNNPRTRAFKILINVDNIVKTGLITALERYSSGIGLYGSWVNGTNTEISDIDIWIKPKATFKQSETSILSNEVTKRLNVEAQVLILNKERLEHLKKDNVVFFHSLLFGSMKLYGEDIE